MTGESRPLGQSAMSRFKRMLRRVVLEPLFVLAVVAAFFVVGLLAVHGVEAITR